MGVGNSYAGIDEYAVSLVKHKAYILAGQVGFTKADREDLEQSMILELLLRLPGFNPQRAQKDTFITMVIEHAVLKIIEKQIAGIRDYRLCGGSLNDYLEDEEGNRIERIERMSEDEYFRRICGQIRSRQDQVEFAIDLERIIAELPLELRSLCERLEGRNYQ